MVFSMESGEVLPTTRATRTSKIDQKLPYYVIAILQPVPLKPLTKAISKEANKST